MLDVRVEGGTSAGVKRPLRPASAPWLCGCVVTWIELDPETFETVDVEGQVQRPGYLVRCPDCLARRPE